VLFSLAKQGENALRTFSYAVVFCAFLSTTAAAQTSDPAAASPKMPAGVARNIPVIKCVDRNAAAACKSLKELVDARDKGLQAQVLGTPESRRRTSYVCLRPNADFFSIVALDIPGPKAYVSKLNTDEEIARYADDSVPTNATMREMMERYRTTEENAEFMDFSDPPAISQYTKDKWYQDHSKEFVYSPGQVLDFAYQDGINMGPVEDWGEWSMLASSRNGKQNDPPTWFLGAYAWIERFNSQHEDQSAKDDDPEHGHISVDQSSIRVHYKYRNSSGDMVDYTMQINRLTGRFVESFKYSYGPDRDSGTCMIFK
jgi:hypothetical protein